MPFTIGKVARAAGVSVQTVRYYESRGLMRAAFRKPSGYRLFDEGAVGRLKFIRGAQKLGFNLAEIKILIGYWEKGVHDCADLKKRLLGKIGTVDREMEELKGRSRSLKELAGICDRKVPGCSAKCLVLERILAD